MEPTQSTASDLQEELHPLVSSFTSHRSAENGLVIVQKEAQLGDACILADFLLLFCPFGTLANDGAGLEAPSSAVSTSCAPYDSSDLQRTSVLAAQWDTRYNIWRILKILDMALAVCFIPLYLILAVLLPESQWEHSCEKGAVVGDEEQLQVHHESATHVWNRTRDGRLRREE